MLNSPEDAAYQVKSVGTLWRIENTYWNQYLWFKGSKQGVYVTRNGDEDEAYSQWIIRLIRKTKGR